MGNVCLRTSAYDGSVSYLEMENGRRDLIGSGHSYKPYYFFFENGDFAEYGAIQVTMDEFLACQGAEEVLGNAETDGFKAAGILYRGNGLISTFAGTMRMNADMTAGIRPSGCAQAL